MAPLRLRAGLVEVTSSLLFFVASSADCSVEKTCLLCSGPRDSLIGKSPGDHGPESIFLAGRKASAGPRAASMGRTSCLGGAVVGHRAVVSSSPQPLRLVASIRGGSEVHPDTCAGPVETRAGPMGAHASPLGGAVGILPFFRAFEL